MSDDYFTHLGFVATDPPTVPRRLLRAVAGTLLAVVVVTSCLPAVLLLA